MYSYKHFTPGGNLKCGKMISYSQAANINPNIKTCTYINSEIMNKSLYAVEALMSRAKANLKILLHNYYYKSFSDQ